MTMLNNFTILRFYNFSNQCVPLLVPFAQTYQNDGVVQLSNCGIVELSNHLNPDVVVGEAMQYAGLATVLKQDGSRLSFIYIIMCAQFLVAQ